jgi:hypothetical protein
MPPEQVRQIAEGTWDGINGPQPARPHRPVGRPRDVVVVKAADSLDRGGAGFAVTAAGS